MIAATIVNDDAGRLDDLAVVLDVFAAFPDGLLAVDPDSLKIVACNRAASDLLGYSSELLRALEITAIESSIENVFYWDEVQCGNYMSMEESAGYYRCADGSVVAIKKRISVIDRAGGAILLIVFSEDKDADVSAEDQLHSSAMLSGTLEATADGILVTRLDGGISNMNHRFTQMWKVPELLINSGDDEAIFLHMQNQFVDSRQYLRALQASTENTDGDSLDTLELKDARVFERFATPLQYDGQMAGFVFSFRDITERQHLVRSLSTKNIELEKASRVKSEFLANMSHEIRTPMNAIIGLSRLCLATDIQEPQRDYVEKIFHAGESLLGIINDVLDFSKIEAGKVAIESIPFRLADVYQRIDQLMRRTAQEKGLQLNLRYHFDGQQLGDQLIGDPLRLGQVLLNLVSNAIKFTESGTVAVSARALTTSEQVVTLEFMVTDSGIGMTSDQRVRLFESFTQADASTTRTYGGTGLGLAICKSLVELMGGNISVRSRPNQGSTFVFSVRCGRTAKSMQQSSQKKSVGWKIATLDDIKGAHLLVVEDNRINQQIAQELLNAAGLQVMIAQNGLEGLALLEQYTFDAILMDMQMPVMDGLEATQVIRSNERYASLPIIAMTANAMADDVERCRVAGMNDHVPKPIDPDYLFNALKKWIPPGKRSPQIHSDQSSGNVLPFVLPAPMFDMSIALKAVAGSYGLLRSLLIIFRRDHRDDGAAIRVALQSSDMNKMQRIVHTLKGIAGSIGAMELFTAAKDLEAFIRNNQELVTESTVEFCISALSRLVAHLDSMDMTMTAREQSSQHPTQPGGGSVTSAKPRLLVIDDDDMILMMLSAVLKENYELVTANNGVSALALAKQQAFDMILLDVTMDEMDGYEVCKRLKAANHTKNTPIVFVTGMDNEEDRQRGLALGACDYLAKPIKRDAVLACVSKNLQR